MLADSAGFGREVALPVRLMSVRPLGEKMLGKPSLAASRRLEQSLFHDPRFVTDERVQLGYSMTSQPHSSGVFLDTAGMLGTFRGAREQWRKELIDALAASSVPTLVVWGEKDKIFPISHLAAAGTLLPHARTHAFANTGHMPQIERAEEFADLVTGFWAAASSSLASAGEGTA